jgi:hypothetical protein
MGKRKSAATDDPDDFGHTNPTPQLDSVFQHSPRNRQPGRHGDQIHAVMGEADGEYGYTDGFLRGFEHTGFRHKRSSLGEWVCGGDDDD